GVDAGRAARHRARRVRRLELRADRVGLRRVLRRLRAGAGDAALFSTGLRVKTAARVAAIVLIALAMVVVRVVWSSRVEYLAAESSTGDARIFLLGRAARLYAPGNPFSRRALDELTQIGRARGADSLAAWQEVRSAILATRSFYTPRPELLDEANGH